jgi:hypothetical protein
MNKAISKSTYRIAPWRSLMSWIGSIDLKTLTRPNALIVVHERVSRSQMRFILLVWQLGRIWSYETGEAVSHYARKHGVHTGTPRNRFWNFYSGRRTNDVAFSEGFSKGICQRPWKTAPHFCRPPQRTTICRCKGHKALRTIGAKTGSPRPKAEGRVSRPICKDRNCVIAKG